jgi:hypothetical protein
VDEEGSSSLFYLPLELLLAHDKIVALTLDARKSTSEMEGFNAEDALVGTSLLNHYSLSIEIPGGQVKVSNRPKSGGKRNGTGG